MPEQLEMALRLLLAAVLGGIIGFQREMWGKPAGMRTLALIGVGSGLFGVISLLGYLGNNTSTIAAGVVTGVGFLGAGAILHRHGGVEGLTTAATITIFLGSKTFFTPILRNSLMAIGAVMSLLRITSALTLINSPGTTFFLPQCTARIFSAKFILSSFILIVITTFVLFAGGEV